ncbi:MAG: FAD-dependent monooxygenase [Gammaproteobacteria bacterium]
MSQKVSIIGAGISGLTAGICLSKKNIPSVIYERNSAISDVSAGINLSPNATNLLQNIGVLEDLISLSHQPSKVVFRDHKGKKISSYKVNRGDEKYLTLNRKRLISVLYDKYKELGGEVVFNNKVENLKSNGITSIDKSFDAELIFGCDGINSSLRTKKFESVPPFFSGFIAWRSIKESSYAFEKNNGEDINFYLGPNSHIVSYPIGEKTYSATCIIKSSQWIEESWVSEGTKDQFKSDFKDWNSELLTYLADSKLYKWGIFQRPPLESFSTNNIFLLGDSAHAMVPFLGQGSCLAIEDSYCLAEILDKKEFIEDAKKIFDDFRLSRCRNIYKRSLRQAKLNHISNPLLTFFRNKLLSNLPLANFMVRDIHSYDLDAELKKII